MHPGYQQNIKYGLKRYLKDTWKIDHCVDILSDTEFNFNIDTELESFRFKAKGARGLPITITRFLKRL